MPRRAAKIDNTQPEIIEEFERFGFKAYSMAATGNGFPDLLVWDKHQNRLVECKSKGGRLTKDQINFIDRWPGPVDICYSRIEARALAQHWEKENGNGDT